jgi:F-box and WD-40 domain protein 1/11
VAGLEFDSRYILTGSRDRSIKVWELQSGRCVGTFVGGEGGHKGSVLCLKFEKEWWRRDRGMGKGKGRRKRKKGFLVSGSSDCSVCVWDLWEEDVGSGAPEGVEVKAEVRRVLRGHSGGVLDLRICERWIVSWCVFLLSDRRYVE